PVAADPPLLGQHRLRIGLVDADQVARQRRALPGEDAADEVSGVYRPGPGAVHLAVSQPVGEVERVDLLDGRQSGDASSGSMPCASARRARARSIARVITSE